MPARLNLRVPAHIMEGIERVVQKRKDGADAAQVIRGLLVKGLEAEGEL